MGLQQQSNAIMTSYGQNQERKKKLRNYTQGQWVRSSLYAFPNETITELLKNISKTNKQNKNNYSVSGNSPKGIQKMGTYI